MRYIENLRVVCETFFVMEQYDPLASPDATQWNSLDEATRLELVEQYHEETDVPLPNPRLHALIHVVVENQLAEGVPQVTQTLKRLMNEGLDRHDSIHAIGFVLAGQIHSVYSGRFTEADLSKPYYRDLKKLKARTWLRQSR